MLLQAKSLGMDFPDGKRQRTIFQDINFSVPPGESLALTGTSGCGKSTILNILGGLLTPTEGSVLIGDTVLSAVSASQQAKFRSTHIGFVFQEWNLVSYLTALDNIALPLQLNGLTVKESRAQAQSTLEKVQMGSLSRSLPEQLSGGEQQRVAVARALVGDKSVILADEPTGSLDSINSTIVIDLLMEQAHARGMCCIIATHDAEIAHRCHEVLDLEQCDKSLSSQARREYS
ncbi:ABC transporter ATP-binding protein [Austwickia chelonae]|uniref:ABC transporter ATP-binding protein n=1 Tax=Austwickia chelonae TaxID=100225 RepID=UPI000E25DA38|nr:ABC transporter ATP-binding protein [Austwickia chelonae]